MTQTTDGGAPPTHPSRVTTDVLDDAVSIGGRKFAMGTILLRTS